MAFEHVRSVLTVVYSIIMQRDGQEMELPRGLRNPHVSSENVGVTDGRSEAGHK